MELKEIFAGKLKSVLQNKLSVKEIGHLIEIPKHPEFGDVAFPCFRLAGIEKKPPAEIAKSIAAQLQGDPFFENVHAAGPYVNAAFFPKEFGAAIVSKVLSEGRNYGADQRGREKTIVLDMSSPNIAKPFSMGHLRSTVIGNALANIAEKCGYKTVKINYLGDWGTQFGKLIIAYQKWGKQAAVEQNPIKELLKLYVKFHEEAETNPELNDQARFAFKQLEDGNLEYLDLWQWFRNESLKAFQDIYELMNISFDSYHGEAFFNDKMNEVVELLINKDLLIESNGAMVVLLEENLPPCLIKKSDGATLYATRDLAAALYRKREYQFDEILYVVGQEQTVHFKQITSVLSKLEMEWAADIKHIPFGLYLKDGKRMSTRKGKVILLEEVLKDAIQLAKDNIIKKNPGLPFADETARAVGVGAVIFHDLKNDRMNNIEFSLEDMLSFEGETGPYVQYTHARAQSVLRKKKVEAYVFTSLEDRDSWGVIKGLNEFPSIIVKAFTEYSPSVLAKYLLELSKSFNKYYSKVRIIEENENLVSRLSLVKAVTEVLSEGLRLLGIEAPEEM